MSSIKTFVNNKKVYNVNNKIAYCFPVLQLEHGIKINEPVKLINKPMSKSNNEFENLIGYGS